MFRKHTFVGWSDGRETWTTFDFGGWLHLRVERQHRYVGTTFVIGIGRYMASIFLNFG